MRSSPDGDGQMNSVESEPPIAPLDASAGTAGMDRRSKIRTYASRCAGNDASSPAASRSKL